ncbi:hypothetical protein LWI28_017221 [Acer negundo]|uniref:Uncharacterized protein n=1 Tax=Acer negundo TaxID=4023 RepID=A0AAD5NLW1_ACENE|nr:hypothetical protein LWI28_017221 [Acer negundo]
MEQMQPRKAFGWAARDSSGVLSPFTFSRRATGEKDVKFKVLYCGICHSDLHFIKNEWEKDWASSYPLVPGHEIVGVVTEVTVISTSPNKKKEAIEHLGAHSFLVSRNQDELQAAVGLVMASCALGIAVGVDIWVANALAILRSIHFGNECGLILFCIEFNVKRVVNWINNSSHSNSACGTILNDVDSLLSYWNVSSVNWIPSRCNKVALGPWSIEDGS